MRTMVRTQSYKPGEVIFPMGVLADRAYLIESGSVKLIRQVEGQMEEVDHLGPGQILGASALTARRLSTTNIGAVAIEPTEVTILSREEWFKLRDSLPGVIRSFLKVLLERPAQALSGVEPQASFYPLNRICNLVRIMAEGARQDEPAKGNAQSGKNREVVLDYDTTVKRIKETLGIPAPAVVSSLKKLDSVNLIKLKAVTLTTRKKTRDPATFREEFQTKRTSKLSLHVTDPQQMTAQIKKLTTELPELAAGSADFVDIFDLATLVKTEPDLIYRKMAQGEVPPEMFMFHRDTVMRWVKEVGRDFFKKPGRRQVRAEDLNALPDLEVIDDQTIQEAISQVGVHNLAHTLRENPERRREFIYRNLSPRMRKIVEQQVADLEQPDKAMAIDQEYKLVQAVKRIKGLA